MIVGPELDIDPKLMFFVPHVAAFPDVGKFVVVGDQYCNCVVYDWGWKLFELDHFCQSIAAIVEVGDDFAQDVLELLGHFDDVGLIESR